MFFENEKGELSGHSDAETARAGSSVTSVSICVIGVNAVQDATEDPTAGVKSPATMPPVTGTNLVTGCRPTR
jgi:hypothetical protein